MATATKSPERTALTTIRVRRLRASTAEAFGIDQQEGFDYLEVCVHGEPRAVAKVQGRKVLITAYKPGFGNCKTLVEAYLVMCKDAKTAGVLS